MSKMNDPEYRRGFFEGKTVGRLMVILPLIKLTMEYTDNFELAMDYLKIPEKTRARIMDYLPIQSGSWKKLPPEEYKISEEILREKLSKK
ncbi:MAG: hypothetical protein Q4E57_08000 [Eubacteriales bacterium]|nr:hypothetical protein [Eubacteriales bacterium]